MDEQTIAAGKRGVDEFMEHINNIYDMYCVAARVGLVSDKEVRNIRNLMVGLLSLVELKEHYNEVEHGKMVAKTAVAFFMSGKMGE